MTEYYKKRYAMSREIIDEQREEIARLKTALEQSKSANKRIKEDCRYIDYNKLQGRFFSKCQENEQLRKALERITEHRVNHFITKEAMVESMFKTAKEALRNVD